MFHYFGDAAALQWAAAPFLPPLPHFPPLPFDPDDFARHGPRDYQFDILWQIVDAIDAGHRRILVQLPTGGGKTVLATALLATARSAQFLVHRDELIKQTSQTLWRAKVPHSFVATGMPFDPSAGVLLSGIATLIKRLGDVDLPDIVIVDEAHHAVSATWSQIIAAFPDAIIIGLTATPQRLDGRGLDAEFDHLIIGPSVRSLMDQGYLCDFDYYAPPPGPEDEAALTGDVVHHYLTHGGGQQGIVFAANRKHSQDLAAEFCARGVPALHVDGTMSKDQRDTADRLFRSGEVRVETNVSLFGEGYDVPNIGYVGLARRTQSLSWFLQMVGRGLRPAPGKDRAVICDHGNNWFQHGMPDDDRQWSLRGKLRGSGAGCNDDATPIHQCMTCYMITPSAVKVCPGCGVDFPVVTRNIRFKEGVLTKIEREEARQQKDAARKAAAEFRKAEEREARSERELVELGRRRGYPQPEGWAKNILRRRAMWKGGR